MADAAPGGTPANDGAGRGGAARLRVRYGETDQMGVAYYANYLDWFTEGRTERLRSLGVAYAEFEARGVFLPVVEVHCEYRRSARYDDWIRVETRVARCLPVRLRFEYRLVREADGAELAVGYTEHAYVGRDGRPFDLRKRQPELWRWLAGAVGPGPAEWRRHRDNGPGAREDWEGTCDAHGRGGIEECPR